MYIVTMTTSLCYYVSFKKQNLFTFYYHANCFLIKNSLDTQLIQNKNHIFSVELSCLSLMKPLSMVDLSLLLVTTSPSSTMSRGAGAGRNWWW